MTVRWLAGLSLLDPRLLWATVALVAALLIGAAVIAWADRWRKRTDPGVLSPGEQLAAFRLSYERGEMSQEEYERIRARLAPKIRESGPDVRPVGPASRRSDKDKADNDKTGGTPVPPSEPPPSDDPQPTT